MLAGAGIEHRDGRIGTREREKRNGVGLFLIDLMVDITETPYWRVVALAPLYILPWTSLLGLLTTIATVAICLLYDSIFIIG